VDLSRPVARPEAPVVWRERDRRPADRFGGEHAGPVRRTPMGSRTRAIVPLRAAGVVGHIVGGVARAIVNSVAVISLFGFGGRLRRRFARVLRVIEAVARLIVPRSSVAPSPFASAREPVTQAHRVHCARGIARRLKMPLRALSSDAWAGSAGRRMVPSPGAAAVHRAANGTRSHRDPRSVRAGGCGVHWARVRCPFSIAWELPS